MNKPKVPPIGHPKSPDTLRPLKTPKVTPKVPPKVPPKVTLK